MPNTRHGPCLGPLWFRQRLSRRQHAHDHAGAEGPVMTRGGHHGQLAGGAGTVINRESMERSTQEAALNATGVNLASNTPTPIATPSDRGGASATGGHDREADSNSPSELAPIRRGRRGRPRRGHGRWPRPVRTLDYVVPGLVGFLLLALALTVTGTGIGDSQRHSPHGPHTAWSDGHGLSGRTVASGGAGRVPPRLAWRSTVSTAPSPGSAVWVSARWWRGPSTTRAAAPRSRDPLPAHRGSVRVGVRGDPSGVGRAPRVVLAQGQDPDAVLNRVLTNIRNWLMGLLVGLATLFLTIGGIRYLLAGGDPGEVEAAKRAFKSAAVGYALAALAPSLVEILRSLVGA